MHDVVIIGGGPAGAALGCYLSQAGISNIIFDKAHHPRPHVGESLVPSTTRIFEDIGFLPTMEKEGFVRKYGASWHPHRRKASVRIAFNEYPQAGVHQDYTYHVDRGRFDHALLMHAASKGSQVIQGAGVSDVMFDGERACGVRVRLGDQRVEVPCRLVVDASGRNTLLGRQLGLKQNDPEFNQFAVHGWFEGVDRSDAATGHDIHIYFLPVRRGWIWQIPITETVTSIGVVAEKDVFRRGNADHQAWFDELVASSPDCAHALRNARRVNDLKVEADYSYQMSRLVGDGYMLIGDAARFVDPIFSSGVSVALYSARFASEAIAAAVQQQDFGAEVLRPYEERLRRGTTVWYEFIRLYYKLLPLFTHFIKSETYRHQVLQLLQGDVYDRAETPVLDAMRAFIDDVETTEDHLFRSYLDPSIGLDGLGA